MIAAVDWQTLIYLIGGTSGLGAGAIAFVTFLRRQSSGTFTIEAAKGAVVLQTTVMDRVQEDYERMSHEYERVSKENAEMRVRLESLEDQVRSFGRMHERIELLTREKAELEKRVEHLEQENAELKTRIAAVNGG